MKRVLACGVFDYFHPGHQAFLTQAKALGDELIVVVARDQNVQRIKGFAPTHTEDERRKAVAQSQIADQVLLGKETDYFLEIVHELQPQVLALGYDQQLPAAFGEEFPEIEVITLIAEKPEEFKSSRYRKM